MKHCQLTTRKVAASKKPGHYGDGGGLYLQVSKYGTQSWAFRFVSPSTGRTREMGLGSLLTFSLGGARERARECRQLVATGIDPIEAKQARRGEAMAKAAARITFKEAAERYIASHKSGWKNEKHHAQWTATLKTFAYPVIGSLPVDAIELPHILKVLEPIWTTKTETASRLQARIERILAWATVRKHRKGDNPAKWVGHLSELLTAKKLLKEEKHLPALPYADVPAFMTELRARDGTAARALELCILTATRTGDVRGAKREHVDIETATWTIPRTKNGKPLEVPLSARAVAIIESLPQEDGDFVFTSARAGKPLSTTALIDLVRMMHGTATTHGFRSAFRDWCGDLTNYDREVAEHALAHTIKSATEASYRRTSAFQKRRRLMNAWADYCASTPVATGEVIALHGGAA